MKKSKIYMGCLGVFLLLSTLFYFTIWQFIAGFMLDLPGRYVLREMHKPEIYKPVSERLALYCQSDPNQFPERMDFAWLPAELNEIEREDRMQSINDLAPDYAHVRMSGGFHHFGYILDLDTGKSTTTTNAWILSLYNGSDSWSDSDKVTLYEFEMPKDRSITAEELLPLVMAEYDKEIAKVAEEYEKEDLAKSKEETRLFLSGQQAETTGSSLRSE